MLGRVVDHRQVRDRTQRIGRFVGQRARGDGVGGLGPAIGIGWNEAAQRWFTPPADELEMDGRQRPVDEDSLLGVASVGPDGWSRSSLPAFRELKVTDDVLEEAGFSLPTSRQTGTQQHHLSTFLLVDVMSAAGGSQATVRKAIDELIEAGQVEKAGPAPDHSGRGRATSQSTRI